jgi:hypothetical protein
MKVGYILPIQSIQSQLYANRMQMGTYNFAYINAIQPIKMKSVFEDELEERAKQYVEDEVTQKEDFPGHPVPYKGFIQPNPVNLSIDIAKVCGKGIQINTYI